MLKNIDLEPVTRGEFKLRIDELASMVSDGFTAMGARIDQRFEQIDQRFEQIESRLRHINSRLDMLETDMADLRSMKKDIALTNRLLDRMVNKSDLVKIEKRVRRLERKVGIA